MTGAKIIADSISEQGIRITTLELEIPRFLLAQFNTHRMFSRSAQSSRAVPVQKMIGRIDDNYKAPVFKKNQAGMQSNEKLDDEIARDAVITWNFAIDDMICRAQQLRDLGVHKQWTNRLLEPFSTVKVVVTATEWDNFFKLRLHHDAQPEIQELAQAMKIAMDKSEPKLLRAGQWHLPYVTEFDLFNTTDDEFELLPKISAARCARVSYLNHDNTSPCIEKDLELARQLLADGHLSPFEHQSKPISVRFVDNGLECMEVDGITHIDKFAGLWSNNFRGWIQHRALIGDQNNG